MKSHRVREWWEKSKNKCWLQEQPAPAEPEVVAPVVPVPAAPAATTPTKEPVEPEPELEPAVPAKEPTKPEAEPKEEPTEEPLEPEAEPEEEPAVGADTAIEFDLEKEEFKKLIADGKDEEAMDKLMGLRGQENIKPLDRKFIEDNLAVLSLAEDTNLAEVREAIKKLANKDEGTMVSSLLDEEINKSDTLKQVLIKMSNFGASKADMFRKVFACCVSGVQIGFGGTSPDIEKPKKVKKGEEPATEEPETYSTRCYSKFGTIEVGDWMPKPDDPEKFLTEEELARFRGEGSPNEQEALRQRIIIDSMIERFSGRDFVVLVSNYETGKCTLIQLNFVTFVKEGYTTGKIVPKISTDATTTASISTNGEWIPLSDIDLVYLKEDIEGKIDELPFVKCTDSKIYLVISEYDFVSLSTDVSSGVFFQEYTYEADVESLRTIQRCVPDIKEMLLRKC